MVKVLAALLFALALLLARPSRAEETVVLWHAYRGDEEKALLAVVRSFESTHAGVTVDVLAVPYEAYAAKLQAAVPRAHGPDLFIEAHQGIGSYLAEDLIAPIGDGFPEADIPGFDRGATEAVTWQGVRYAVPLANKCVALYVNEALIPRAPASLGELLGMRPLLPKGVYPLAYAAERVDYHAAFLHAFGGRLVDRDGRYTFFGPAAEKSLLYVRGLLENGFIPDEATGTLVKDLFTTGRAAAVIDGPWFMADLGDTKVRYRVEPLPPLLGPDTPMQPILAVEGVFASHGGAMRPTARELARWLGADDSALVRAKVGHQVVPRPALWKGPLSAAQAPDLANVRAFAAAAATAIPMSATRGMQATWEPALSALKKVLRRDQEPGPALEEGEHRWEDVMRPLPPAASPVPLVVLSSLGLLAVVAYTMRQLSFPSFRRELKASLPAYGYVTHALVVVLALVVFPLAAGALTSFFAGTREAPRYIGLANYVSILTARGGDLLGHGSFYLTLLVTILWTVVNVTFHVGIGLVLGILLSRPLLRLRGIYRVLLILPWAVPSYVTALAWKGMFQRQFGAVNAFLRLVGVEPVSWFAHFSTAFTANVATNVWLGFPFMLVVVQGALTSIPRDVLEAAEVDGATRWQRFRLVTLPLLLPVLLPAVILGAVWTFNMFNVVFLVSGGEPDGTTDILVSEAYRWAFTRDNQYGYAAAYAVLIFFLLAGSSRLFGQRLTSEGA
jgi:arabinogalactan oligomer/maltooligosaccharide transport system permease protein